MIPHRMTALTLQLGETAVAECFKALYFKQVGEKDKTYEDISKSSRPQSLFLLLSSSWSLRFAVNPALPPRCNWKIKWGVQILAAKSRFWEVEGIRAKRTLGTRRRTVSASKLSHYCVNSIQLQVGLFQGQKLTVKPGSMIPPWRRHDRMVPGWRLRVSINYNVYFIKSLHTSPTPCFMFRSLHKKHRYFLLLFLMETPCVPCEFGRELSYIFFFVIR